MEERYDEWINDFAKLVDNQSYETAVNHLTKGFEILFSSPSLYKVYDVASEIPNQYYKKSFSKLLLGWLSFICGDNKRVDWVLNSINEVELKSIDDISTFYALKAMTTFVKCEKESLKYAKLALDVLPEESNNFTAGNAHMTYARQLTNVKKYREGAKHFEKAYDIFKGIGNTFLSVNCFVNECLNLYTLGKCKEVINKCQEVLMFSSSQKTKADNYINIIKLPMGMCYYEMNKISLAIDALEISKSAIDNLKLVHMHGLVEKYLFDCYRIINDYENMYRILEDLESIFKNLHYPQIKYLITTMRIKSVSALKQKPRKKWIEELELAYQLYSKLTPTFILEALTELKLKGLSEAMSKDILIERLNELNSIGNIPEIQSISLCLAELFYSLGDSGSSKAYLKIACDICLEYGLIVQFLNHNLDCYIYLKDIQPSLAKKFNQNYKRNESFRIPQTQIKENLTNRELEILQLIAKGKSNREISETLFISIGTTKWHINNIFSKLEVNKRFDAIEKAKQLNLI